MNRKKMRRRIDRAVVIARKWRLNRTVEATLEQYSCDVKAQVYGPLNPAYWQVLQISTSGVSQEESSNA